MAIVRAGVPALFGILLLLGAIGPFSRALLDPESGDSLISASGIGAIPVGIGLAMLVVAIAIGRRSRLGLVLGVLLGLGAAVLGVLFILSVLPQINEGPFNFVVPAIGVAGIVILASLGYAGLLLRGRRSFATGWQPPDRRYATALGIIAVVTLTLTYGISGVASRAAGDQAAAQARARAMVAATTLEVRIFDVTLAPTPDGKATVVDRLTLEIVLQNPEPYDLVEPPTLCLTDQATFADPASKPDIMCWGMPGPADSIRNLLHDSIPVDTTAYTFELRAAGSPCAFEPGIWHARIALLPKLGGYVPGDERLAIDTTFEVSTVAATTGPAGDSTVAVGLNCGKVTY